MGSTCCKNDANHRVMIERIQNFNFNDSKQEFPLEQRVIRELMLDTKTVY